MKFLLVGINAKYIHSNPAVYSLRAYVGRSLQEHVSVAEFTINEKTEDILAKIYDQQPDAIGISCYIWNIQVVKTLLAELPKILPHADIWLGGPEVSYDSEEWVRKYPCLTGIMVGEGEASFRELVQWYVVREASLQDIAGLCLPSGYTKKREVMDLSDIPFIYENMEVFQNRILYYESSRGCPFRCSYCLSSIDQKVRMRDINLVEQELQYFLDQQVKQVKFVDRTFNCNREHTRRIWTYLRDHDNGITNFHFEIAADLLNEEELELLHSLRPGLVQLEIGVQSTNEHTIREIHRVMDVEKLEGIVAKIHEGRNVHQHLDLIVGLPHENYESFGRSFDQVYAMKPDQLQMGFLKMLKGSFMYQHGEQYGIVYSSEAPYEVLYTKWVSYAEVRKLKGIEEMVELYYNSGQFTHTLHYLLSFFQSPFACFEALSAFFSEEGYDIHTPSRLYRYDVLLQFGQKYINTLQFPQGMEVLKEVLVFDIYLRENMKSRPAYAPAAAEEQKARQRLFYQREAETHRYLPDYQDLDKVQLSRQTHMEWFRYKVWEEDTRRIMEQSDQLYCVLFDYRNRDKLDYSARTVIWEEIPEMKEGCKYTF